MTPIACWTFTEAGPEGGEVLPYMNILKRINYRLTNPDDPAQVLYCTADRHAASSAGKRWQKRYAGSVQANRALLMAWVPRDGWTDEAGTKENLLATCARLFQEASARKNNVSQNVSQDVAL